MSDLPLKQILTLSLILFLPAKLLSPPDPSVMIVRPEPFNPYLALWEATCRVESSKVEHSINYQEKAFGIAQIRAGKLKDYNNQTGSSYTLDDCLDPGVSYKIWIHFAKKYGHKDPERIAKRWNGSGKITEIYWEKVKKHL
jgi:hypothetical protein